MKQTRDLEKFYDNIRVYQNDLHRKNQKKIRVGLKINIFLPLVFLIISFITQSSKLVFLVLWIVSLFGIAFYLLYVEFTDVKLQKKMNEFGIDNDDEIQSLIGNQVERGLDEFDDKIGITRNIQKIIASDVKRLSKNVVAYVVIIGLTVIPSLYAWFNILSNWDPYGQKATSHLQVAVVSVDKGEKFGSKKLNIGNMIIDNLKENKTIDWVFVDTKKEAVDGVHAGDYYAALVIDDNFSKDMVSFLNSEIVNPKITYYQNEKKNAIAPKITGKVKTAIQREVDVAFINTIADALIQTGDYLVTEDENGKHSGQLIGRLEQLDNNMKTVILVLDSYDSVMESSKSLMSSSKDVVINVNDSLSIAKVLAESMKDAIVTVSQSTNISSDVITNYLNDTKAKIEELKVVDLKNELKKSLEDGRAALNTFSEKEQSAKASWDSVKGNLAGIDTGNATVNEEIQNSITQIDDTFNRLDSSISELNAVLNDPNMNLDEKLDRLETTVNGLKNKLDDLKQKLNESVVPKLNSVYADLQKSMDQTARILGNKEAAFSKVIGNIGKVDTKLTGSEQDLKKAKEEAERLEEKLSKLIGELKGVTNEEQYQKFVGLIKNDPGFLADFISSPVDVTEKYIYPVENNGSMTAPFYIVLSIWVGALIMSTILKTEVHDKSNLKNVKNWQCFVGRFFTTYVVGQIQTIITVFGALFFVGIQCKHPVLMMIACSWTTFVFDLLLYSFTYSFGNVGEALSVILMVIQVAGAGGTFPIEVLPQVFQKLYTFMPFNYAMNAVRECIAGRYQNDYWWYLLTLLLYVVIAVAIGVLLYYPCKKLNDKVEKSKDNSGILI